MRRTMLCLGLLALCAAPARAHFIWLLPPGKDQAGVRMVFSDALAPDDADLLERIKQTQVFACSSAGVVTPLKFEKAGDAFALPAPGKDTTFYLGFCRYGVFQRAGAEPARLNYYAKAIVGGAKDINKLNEVTAEQLPLDIGLAPLGTFRVTWKGKPLPSTKVFLTTPDGKRETTTDNEGRFKLGEVKKLDGLFGIRVGHTVKEEGELDGKKYTSSRHWATLTFDGGLLQLKPGGGAREGAGEPFSTSTGAPVKAALKEDPEASKLLADARAARASWDGFPGFAADLELNVEGRLVKGKVEVDAKGKVKIEGVEDMALEGWLRRQMASIVGHRMSDGTDLKTPCAFLANDADHPLGRAIQVLNDEFHSSYRIRDRQVIVVNRTMKDSRFTITVLENKLTAEKQFLPAHYVVNSWDLKSNALRSSMTFFHEWARVGRYDLPTTSLIVTATADGKQEARKLTLSNHKLR